MQNISDAQQSSVIAVVAKIPVAEARKPFLIELEKRLPKTGKVSDAQLLAAINAALKSFPPGAYQGDALGVRPTSDDCAHMTLAEIAAAYQRCLKPPSWVWPPKPPPTQEELKAMAAAQAAMTPEELAERYHRSLFNSDAEWEAAKAAEEARRQAEETADTTPFPLGPSPPHVPMIHATANRDDAASAEPEHFPTDDDLRKAMADRPEEDEDARATRALNQQLERERLARRRRGGPTKVFFR